MNAQKWIFGASKSEALLRRAICVVAIAYLMSSLLLQSTLIFTVFGLFLIHRAILRCSPSGCVVENGTQWLCKVPGAELARACTLESLTIFRRALVVRGRFTDGAPVCFYWLVFADAMDEEQWRTFRCELFLQQSIASS